MCCSALHPQESGGRQFWGMNSDDDMCLIDDKDEFLEGKNKFRSLMSDDIKVIALASCRLLCYTRN